MEVGYIKDLNVAATAHEIGYVDRLINNGEPCSYRVLAKSKDSSCAIYQIAVGNGLYKGGTQIYAATSNIKILKEAFPLAEEVNNDDGRHQSKKEIKKALGLVDDYEWFVGKKKEVK